MYEYVWVCIHKKVAGKDKSPDTAKKNSQFHVKVIRLNTDTVLFLKAIKYIFNIIFSSIKRKFGIKKLTYKIKKIQHFFFFFSYFFVKHSKKILKLRGFHQKKNFSLANICTHIYIFLLVHNFIFKYFRFYFFSKKIFFILRIIKNLGIIINLLKINIFFFNYAYTIIF